MTSPKLGFLVAILCLGATGCSASSNSAAPARPDEVVVAESTAAPNEVPNVAPELSPGGVTTGAVEISGATIDYVVFVPTGFSIGDEAPLLLAFPPGGQNLGLAQSLVEGTYAPEAERLGWVVVSPAAPNGQLYFEGSEALVPGLLDWVETWVTPEGGAPHVAGVSNGGISTFRYAAENPERVRSMVTFPGFPRSDEDQAALSSLAGVPIRMFVGGTDTGWIEPAEQTVATIEALGGDIELTIFEGEGHIIDSTRDGVLIFEELESFR